MAQLSDFPSASAADTVAYCWDQVEGNRHKLVASWLVLVGAVVVADVVGPIVFATILSRVASLPRSAPVDEWSTFGALLIAYALTGMVSVALWRVAGWLEWGACVRSFATGITNGYEHLLSLSYRWHLDHPAGEVLSSLGNYSWAFAEMVDVASWGLVPVVVLVLAACGVLAFYAWPAAVALLVMVGGFTFVLSRRLPQVRAASQEFEDRHSRATGVVSDTVTNLTSVRAAAGEEQERATVRRLMSDAVTADLGARSIFMRTQLQLETTIVVTTLLALIAGTTMAIHHWASTAAIYLVLYYAAQVAFALEQSFEHLRSFARALGRAAKFAAIAAEPAEITDTLGAVPLETRGGGVVFDRIVFGYHRGTPLFDGLALTVDPGEHVALVGGSGSGKSTLSRLLLRFMDVDGGSILFDGQDVRTVTLESLRRNVSYVSQDPQLLHRTIAENICYGLDEVDGEMVAEVGKAAHVEEFVYDLPDGYDTVVGERGLKLSGGQRQRVAIAQAMAKRAPVLVLDEATSALDSESEHLVQEAMWRLMAGSTALVIAHRLSTIAHMDRIVVLDRGRIVEEGTHRQLLSTGGRGTYARLWQHQSGGFLVD